MAFFVSNLLFYLQVQWLSRFVYTCVVTAFAVGVHVSPRLSARLLQCGCDTCNNQPQCHQSQDSYKTCSSQMLEILAVNHAPQYVMPTNAFCLSPCSISSARSIPFLALEFGAPSCFSDVCDSTGGRGGGCILRAATDPSGGGRLRDVKEGSPPLLGHIKGQVLPGQPEHIAGKTRALQTPYSDGNVCCG